MRIPGQDHAANVSSPEEMNATERISSSMEDNNVNSLAVADQPNYSVASYETYTVGTIDAAIVEEIHDDNGDESPLVPQNEMEAVRLVSPPGIPDVVPEVDIEEVNVNDTSGASVSGLTTSLWTETNSYAATAASSRTDDGEDRQETIHDLDTKRPASPLKAVSSPAIPARREISDESRKVSLGSGEFPDFKAQVNSRSFAVVAEEHQDADSLLATAQEALHEFMDPGPEYKGQVTGRPANPPPMPGGSPVSSRQVSNTTSAGGSGGTQPNSGSNHRDEHIPVVNAVLVPAERLAEEATQHSRQPIVHGSNPVTAAAASQERGENGSGASTLTTTENSANSHAQHSRSKSSSGADNVTPPASERQFWITVIVVAMLLNSLLVGGAVVGGFCAAGRCSSSNSNIDSISGSATVGGVAPTTASPSLAPSAHGRLLSATPSQSPTQATHAKGVVASPTMATATQTPTFTVITLMPVPTVSPRPVEVDSGTVAAPSTTMYPTSEQSFNAEKISVQPTPLLVGDVPPPPPSAPVGIMLTPITTPIPPPMGGGRDRFPPTSSPFPTVAPSISPRPTSSRNPTSTPTTLSPTVTARPMTDYPTFIPTIPLMPTTPYPTVSPSVSRRPSVSPFPSFPPNTPYPTTSDGAVPAFETGETFPSGNNVPSDFPSLSPSQSPVAETEASSTFAPATQEHTQKEKDRFPLVLLAPIVIGAEAVILLGLYLYYRRWKHQQKLYTTTVGTDTGTKSLSCWDEESEVMI